MLTIVYFKNALEKVADLNFDALISRVDQMAYEVHQEGAALRRLVNTSQELANAGEGHVLALLEGDDDLHTVDLHHVKLCQLLLELIQLFGASLLYFRVENFEQLLLIFFSLKGLLARDKDIECLCKEANEVDLIQLFINLPPIHGVAHATGPINEAAGAASPKAHWLELLLEDLA